MIFNLGKAKQTSSQEGSVNQDTLKRWRDVAAKLHGTKDSSDSSASGSSISSVGSSVGVSTLGKRDGNPAIDEIKLDSMQAVQWPDPKATISLTKEISLSQELHLEDAPAPKTEKRFNLRSALSNLSQLTEVESVSPVKIGKTQKTESPVAELKEQTKESISDKPIAEEAISGPTLSGQKTLPADPSISLQEDLRRRFGSNIRSALGPGTIIEGTFSFDSPVCIDGTLIGEVNSSSVLIVGNNATVDAKVKVGSLIVVGSVTGPIDAQDLVEIKSTGILEGDIKTKRIVIEDGGWFSGRCTPRK